MSNHVSHCCARSGRFFHIHSLSNPPHLAQPAELAPHGSEALEEASQTSSLTGLNCCMPKTSIPVSLGPADGKPFSGLSPRVHHAIAVIRLGNRTSSKGGFATTTRGCTGTSVREVEYSPFSLHSNAAQTRYPRKPAVVTTWRGHRER